MRIYKYLHSCILLEKDGKRLLIDPGTFSFVEKKITPDDIGSVDAILITHQHPDHYYPGALKVILQKKQARIFTNGQIGELLKKEGIPCELIRDGERREAEGFEIEAFNAPHASMPIALPENMAFFVDSMFLHPGDSFQISNGKVMGTKVLALPITAPWATLTDAFEFAKKMRPQVIVPIHDAILKDFMLERVYEMCKTKFGEMGIQFHPLGLGESFETEI